MKRIISVILTIALVLGISMEYSLHTLMKRLRLARGGRLHNNLQYVQRVNRKSSCY